MSRHTWQSLRWSLAGLACITWLVPIQAMGAGPVKEAAASTSNQQTTKVQDIALQSGGRFTGQFVNAEGRPQANQIVLVQRQGGQPVQTRTDERGRFALEGATGGLYQVATHDSAVVCRCWTQKAAPPGSTSDLLIVSGDGIQRGQRPIGEFLFSAPVLVALVIAAAIAIPIAVHNSQDAS